MMRWCRWHLFERNIITVAAREHDDGMEDCCGGAAPRLALCGGCLLQLTPRRLRHRRRVGGAHKPRPSARDAAPRVACQRLLGPANVGTLIFRTRLVFTHQKRC